jgi:NAD(P)-dependent dehydrogenase (short-subunit alcohol dehydrogenase family)
MEIGIGLMIARALAANGAAKVYIVGRRENVLQEAATQHPAIIPLPGDITSKESLQQIAKRVTEEVGYVNLLVANSGIMGPGVRGLSPDATLSDFVEAAWKLDMEATTETFNINVTGTLFTTLAFLELLDAGNKKGNMGNKNTSQVVATSSIAGFSRLRGSSFAYNTSKAATTHLMKMLSTYLVPWNIRCNVLAPGC